MAHLWPWTRKVAFACLIAGAVLFTASLVAVAYPVARTVGCACTASVGMLLFLLSRRRGTKLPKWPDDEYALTVLFLCSAWTGGLHSPVAVAAFAPATRVFQTGRATWRSALRLGAVCGGLALLALAPSSWVGPRPPDVAYVPSMLMFLISTFIMHVWRTSVEAQRLGATIDEVVRAREEVGARAVERARELDLLTARMSEELADPIRDVEALVHAAATGAPDEDSREQLEVVEGELARMQSILQEYRAFSRPVESLRLELVELGDLVDEALAALEGRAHAAGVALGSEGGGRTLADPRRVAEALLNLVGNAIEATPRGGRVTVEVRERPSRIDLVVRDTGAGMSSEVLGRLGSPFFTTRAQGTGLGVLTARGVFARHGGSLVFESAPGRGTRAIASLPRRGSDELPGERREPTASPPSSVEPDLARGQ